MTSELAPYRILVAVTGSVAAIKLPLLVRLLREKAQDRAVEIRVVTTEHARHFYNEQEVDANIYGESHEWQAWKSVADPVLHIELRRWAQIMVIAPLDANTLAKLANGLCDNLLTCIARAWDSDRPVLVCPAMNTHMWTHPFTARHLDILRDMLGWRVCGPISKRLACGDVGEGAMAEAETIATTVWEMLGNLICI
ncbi:flavo protein [Thamnocephalis sphaerospora]|uniref:Flavo protein n=1 Tax=Thamnocephalis sphaerospora TaxID=78915 RepID=A0A4V1IWK8_9FUNG|nr:flavo protein [Thamnocephalis sphaerospora]|eukprot:RKP07909.1 flavo protein [Thamnocephalis sphaerospora]